MTLPGSGTLDYNSIRAEFGSPSSNVYLNLYYRGGPYTYNVPANSNITTSSSGQLSVSNFYGAKNKTDYFQGNGTSHNTGGKSPVIYFGVGHPGGGSWGDSVGKIGGTAYTASKFYSANDISGFVFNMGSGANDGNFVSRAFNCYDSGGGNLFTLTTTSVPAPIRTQPDANGNYQFFLDNLNGAPGAYSPGTISGPPGTLGGYFVIKAF